MPRRRRLIQKASHTVVRATVIPLISSHMNLRTSIGVGMSSVGQKRDEQLPEEEEGEHRGESGESGDRNTRMIRSMGSAGMGRARVAIVSAPSSGAT